MSDANYQVINNGNLLQISAQQSFYKNKHEIIFQHILGDIEDNNYKKIFFSASDAILNKTDQNIFFNKKVNIFSYDHFALYADKAFYWLKKKIINGSDNIKFNNYIGNIVAQDFVFYLAEKRYFFSNNVIITNDDKNIIKGNKLYIDDIKYRIEVLDKPQYQDSNIKIIADRFIILYDKLLNNKFLLKKILADNNIKIISQNSVVTANKGEYYPHKQEIIVTDNVIVTKEENIIKGEKLIYYVVDDSFKILSQEENKVKINIKKNE